MIELMLPQLSAAALLAVAGAAHCVGMCGGIGTALTFTVPAARREGLRLWGWQLLFGVVRCCVGWNGPAPWSGADCSRWCGACCRWIAPPRR